MSSAAEALRNPRSVLGSQGFWRTRHTRYQRQILGLVRILADPGQGHPESRSRQREKRVFRHQLGEIPRTSRLGDFPKNSFRMGHFNTRQYECQLLDSWIVEGDQLVQPLVCRTPRSLASPCELQSLPGSGSEDNAGRATSVAVDGVVSREVGSFVLEMSAGILRE